MLRRRTGAAIAALRRSRQISNRSAFSTAATKRRPEADEAEDSYGNDYGAGPSRLPYISLDERHVSDELLIAAGAGPAPRMLSSRNRWTKVEADIADPSPGSISGYRRTIHEVIGLAKEQNRDPRWNELVRALEDRYSNFDLHTLSRLELHAVLHSLCREQAHRATAAALLRQILEKVHASSEQARPQTRKLRISPRTLEAIFKQDVLKEGRPWLFQTKHQLSLHEDMYYGKPSLLEQSSARPHPRSRIFLDLLDLLRETRQPRPYHVYHALISQLCMQMLPDEAAKVYVGMVEEWITEGRLAMGADPRDLSQHGAPPEDPKEREDREERFEFLRLWWKGIRSWALPGEVLSPHKRLDLWHPRNSSLGQRLRNFPIPMPASPPLLVPTPDEQLLRLVLASIALNPSTVTPSRFAASMRACAILANTVLTRTIPFLSKGELFDVLARAPRKPPVYPDGMLELPPHEDRWAYQASTHVHLAIQSVLWAPPVGSSIAMYLEQAREAVARGEKAPPPPPEVYTLPPFCFDTCIVLIRYVIRRVRNLQVLSKLLKYIKSTFESQKEKMTELFSMLAREGRIMRDPSLALEAENKIFGGTGLSEEAFLSWQTKMLAGLRNLGTKSAMWKADKVEEYLERLPRADPDYQPILAEFESVDANDKAIVALITRLGADGAREQLKYVARKLIPYFSFNRETAEASAEAYYESNDQYKPASGKIRPPELSMHVLTALLGAFARNGDLRMCERVWRVAWEQEHRWRQWWARKRETVKDTSTNPLAEGHLVPIEAYTAMVKVYHISAQAHGNQSADSDQPLAHFPAWRDFPAETRGMSKAEACDYMVWYMYERARDAWRLRMQETGGLGRPQFSGRLRPDQRFFDQVIDARKHHWETMIDPIASSTVTFTVERGRLKRLASDMKFFDVPMSPTIYRALGWSMDQRKSDKAFLTEQRGGYRGDRAQWERENLGDLPVRIDEETEGQFILPLALRGWNMQTARDRARWTLKVRNKRSLLRFRTRDQKLLETGSSKLTGKLAALMEGKEVPADVPYVRKREYIRTGGFKKDDSKRQESDHM